MNRRNKCRMDYEQLCAGNNNRIASDMASGQPGQGRRIIAGIIASLLLAGTAHATDIHLHEGLKNGDVVYSYQAGATEPLTAKAHSTTPSNLVSGVCALAMNYVSNKPGTLGGYGLGVRQVSGYAMVEYDGGNSDQQAYNDFGPRGTHKFAAWAWTGTEPSPNTNLIESLSAGTVEIYVTDASKLPTRTVSLTPQAVPLMDGLSRDDLTLTNNRPTCTEAGRNPVSAGSTRDTEAGGWRFPTSDRNVALVVEHPTARAKVHNACQTGGHAAACQRIRSFAVAHHKH